MPFPEMLGDLHRRDEQPVVFFYDLDMLYLRFHGVLLVCVFFSPAQPDERALSRRRISAAPQGRIESTLQLAVRPVVIVLSILPVRSMIFLRIVL